MVIDKDTILKYDVAGPRYTSYPTAPEWGPQVDAAVYAEKLRLFGRNDKTLSLYLHIPFCEQLCYFCACHKVIRPQDEKTGRDYVDVLSLEIDLIRQKIGGRKSVRQLHWGGGTPTYLSSEQTRRLFNKITTAFDVDLSGEVAIEIDPRTVTSEKIDLLRTLGFNRVSMGVQDFDAKVQDDINRIQPYEQVAQVNDWCRRARFSSVNFDLIYGLPYQTRQTFAKTVAQVVGLRPDRIALYSFAYVPWLSKPQNKFNLEAIPLQDEKLDIFLNARQQLMEAGYKAIAMDHFALATDAMARAFDRGCLHRNFMGYTLKPADEFLGLGASAIGFVEGAFVQNIKTLPDYVARIKGSHLAIERGKVLTRDDEIRRWVINALMCTFQVDKPLFARTFSMDFDQYFAVESDHLAECQEDGLVELSSDRIQATELGKIFIRNVCMGFDAYLRQKPGQKRYSRTI